MSTLLSDGFDGVTAPALPTGYTFGAGISTTASPSGGITPTSSPNVLVLSPTGTNVHIFSAYNTPDSNSGDVTVQVNGNATGGGRQAFGVFARASSASISGSSGTFYWAVFDPVFNNELDLYKIVSGTQTLIVSVVAVGPLPEWYQIAFSPVGSALTVTVQDLGSGDWLTSTGGWQAGAATAISQADSSISGAGYYGVSLQAVVAESYLDDLLVTTPTPTTTLWFSDSGSTGEDSLPVLATSESATGVESALGFSWMSDAALPSDGHLAANLGGDAGRGDSSIVTTATASDSGLGDDSASLLSIPSTTYAYTVDSGLGDDSASLLMPLCGDQSLDQEAFAESLVLVAADGGFPDDSAGLAILTTAIAYSTIDGGEGSESAPSPTMWASDRPCTSDDGILVLSLGGDGAGTSVADSAIGAEAWSLTSVIIAADLIRPSEAFDRSTLILAVDAGTAAELAAIGLVEDGYHIYMSPASGAPIDYTTIVGTDLGFENTTWTSGTLGSPGTWTFGVRAFNSVGDEQNVDAVVVVILDAYGNDITNRPLPPVGLRAIPQKGATIKVEWAASPAVRPASAATSYAIYMTAGLTPSYGTPAETVPASSALFGTFGCTLQGADGQTYAIAVRAQNVSGQDAGLGFVVATAEATGPGPVLDLVGVAVV